MIISKTASVMKLLQLASQVQASDIYAVEGRPPLFRVNTLMQKGDGAALTSDGIMVCIKEMLSEDQLAHYESQRDLDAGVELPDGTRFRINAFWERGRPSFTARRISSQIPSLEDIQAPNALYDVLEQPYGLVLITGPTGSGKSTLLASMIEYLNQTHELYITTLEDPVEFVFQSKKSTVVQRQLGDDVHSFPQGIRSLLRQNPDVVMVGEMRDLETISSTLTLAETGHLVLATLHTNNAAESVERIVDVFPANQQMQIRMQFALALRMVVTTTLVPRKDSGLVAAREVLVNVPAISSLIREQQTVQIANVLQTAGDMDMHTLDQDLTRLVKEGIITIETAMDHAVNPDRVRELSGVSPLES